MQDRELRELLTQAREFEHTIGAFTFRVRLRTRNELTRLYSRYDGPGAYVEAMSAMVSDSVLWVRGATTRHLGIPGDPLPLPETPEAARELLSEQTSIANELFSEISRRTKERFDAIDGDQKN